MHRRGFTRIELLVVIALVALIGVQDALIWLRVPRDREVARRSEGRNQRKPTGLIRPTDLRTIGTRRSDSPTEWNPIGFLPQPSEVRPFVGLKSKVAPADRPLDLQGVRCQAAPSPRGGSPSGP